MAKNDFKSKYANSQLGVFWAFLKEFIVENERATEGVGPEFFRGQKRLADVQENVNILFPDHMAFPEDGPFAHARYDARDVVAEDAAHGAHHREQQYKE